MSSRLTASPLESLTAHSSSSATTVEVEILTSASWNSAVEIFSSRAISSSVGVRCSWCSSLAWAFSISRARARTERGTQSSARSSSMIAPLMRVIA